MTSKRLTLYQLCDSNFPIGTFSHSFGFETYMMNGKITDSTTFEQWLTTYLKEQVVYSEGLAARFLWEALQKGEQGAILYWANILGAQLLPKEVRLGTQRMGERFLILARELFENPYLDEYDQLLREEKAFAYPVIVFAIVAVSVGASLEECLEAYLYSTVAGLVQNAVRAVPIGQTAGQKILIRFQQQMGETVEKIKTLGEERFGVTAPGIDIAQMNHQFLYARNFMS